MRLILGNQRAAISSRRRIVIRFRLRIASPKSNARLVVGISMRLILGNQRAAISSSRRIVFALVPLRTDAAMQAKHTSASLRVEPLNGMLRKR